MFRKQNVWKHDSRSWKEGIQQLHEKLPRDNRSKRPENVLFFRAVMSRLKRVTTF